MAASRVAVLVGPIAPMPLVSALEDGGFEVQHRDSTKSNCGRALPLNVAVVIALKSDAYGPTLRELARGAKVPYISGAAASSVIRDLIEAGVVPPVKDAKLAAAPIHILMVGNLPQSTRRDLEEGFSKATRQGVAVTGWITPGIPLGDHAFACNGVGIVSDATPPNVKEMVNDWIEGALYNANGDASKATEAPFDLPRVSAPESAWWDCTALLKLVKQVNALRPATPGAERPKRTDPPKWALRQEAREKSRAEQWAKEREAAEAERIALAEAKAREIEADHAAGLLMNSVIDDAKRQRDRDEDEAYTMNARYGAPRLPRVAPPTQEVFQAPIPFPSIEAGARGVSGTWIGGVEVVLLRDAAPAINMDVSTLRGLVASGKVSATTINGEEYLTYDEMEKAEAAIAPLMDAESDLSLVAARSDGLLYSDEAARYLGCGQSTVTQKTSQGFIRRAGKDGRAFLYRREDLDDWRERRKSQATMRRRVGPLGIENAGRAVAVVESVSLADRAAIKHRAEEIQAMLAAAGYQAVTIGADAITVRKIVVEEEEL